MVSAVGASWRALALLISTAWLVAAMAGPGILLHASQRVDTTAPPVEPATPGGDAAGWREMLEAGLVRLPLAGVLGALLAFRPKRRGTPTRTPAVVQTQIILAIVGALIMLVVGASLARAFGIVGAANLIRYRSKIDDPKDAGVMLCCLAVGLASGVGLYGLALFATAFLVAALALVESFEPHNFNQFALQATSITDVANFRPRFEQVLRRFHAECSLRTQSEDELSYDVKVPYGVETDRVTNAILKLDPSGKIAVVWDEKSPKKR